MAADWIGTVATAVVGTAGIVATAWATISSQRAQDRRAVEDEKRRTYAAIFLQGDRVVGAIKRVGSCREPERSGELPGALVELEDRRLSLNSAVYDLMLVASPDVADETVSFYLLCLEAVNRARTGEHGYEPAAFSAERRKLLNRMRVDFGQAALSIRDTPSMAQAGTAG